LYVGSEGNARLMVADVKNSLPMLIFFDLQKYCGSGITLVGLVFVLDGVTALTIQRL